MPFFQAGDGVKTVRLSHYDIPGLVCWFENFTGIKCLELDKQHILHRYYAKYHDWSLHTFQKPSGEFDAISGEVIEFASFIKGIQLFQSQIAGRVKKDFVNDLADEATCPGVLFEIKVLVNFYIVGYEHIRYRDNQVQGKNPDIMFVTSKLRRVYVECTRKRAKQERTVDEDLLMEDLVRSLRDKATEYRQLPVPLIYAVHVPEVISFEGPEFRSDLDRKLQQEFQDPRFGNVCYVAFSSYRVPVVEHVSIDGSAQFGTDLHRLSYKNSFAAPNYRLELKLGPP